MTCEKVALAHRLFGFSWHELCCIVFWPLFYLEEICHGELDQDETELRRSFVDKLAYICDFKKGGSTVTALALQKTYQGVTFWIGANETIKPKVIEFLQKILQVLKTVNGASRQTAETLLLALIVPFNEKRLDYYWTALKKVLPLCMERIDDLGSSAGAKPPSKELTALKTLLGALSKLLETRIDLVRECFEARRNCSAFETLAQLTASGNAHCKSFDDIRHLLGRLGEHLKATKTIVSAALRFLAILDRFQIKARASPPARCSSPADKNLQLASLTQPIKSAAMLKEVVLLVAQAGKYGQTPLFILQTRPASQIRVWITWLATLF